MKRSMTRLHGTLLLLVVFFVFHVSKLNSTSRSFEISSSQKTPYVTASDVPDSTMVVTLTVSDTIVSPDKPIEVWIRLRNLGENRVLWGCGSSSCRLNFLVNKSNKEYVTVTHRVCTQDYRKYFLDPGAECRNRLIWHAEVRERGDNRSFELPPGSYDIIGCAGIFRSEPVGIEVRED